MEPTQKSVTSTWGCMNLWSVVLVTWQIKDPTVGESVGRGSLIPSSKTPYPQAQCKPSSPEEFPLRMCLVNLNLEGVEDIFSLQGATWSRTVHFMRKETHREGAVRTQSGCLIIFFSPWIHLPKWRNWRTSAFWTFRGNYASISWQADLPCCSSTETSDCYDSILLHCQSYLNWKAKPSTLKPLSPSMPLYPNGQSRWHSTKKVLKV